MAKAAFARPRCDTVYMGIHKIGINVSWGGFECKPVRDQSILGAACGTISNGTSYEVLRSSGPSYMCRRRFNRQYPERPVKSS
jgi:hypothetical protein